MKRENYEKVLSILTELVRVDRNLNLIEDNDMFWEAVSGSTKINTKERLLSDLIKIHVFPPYRKHLLKLKEELEKQLEEL